MWRTHAIVCALLLLFAIPVYMFDRYLLKPGGGNWISLDFRGWLITGYLVLAGADIVLGTIGHIAFPSINVLWFHIIVPFLAAAIVLAGIASYQTMRRDQMHQADLDKRQSERQRRLELGGSIELQRWWVLPDESHPSEIHVAFLVRKPGRLALRARGMRVKTIGDGESHPEIYISAVVEHQIPPPADSGASVVKLVAPMKRANPGTVGYYEIALHLTDAIGDISVIYGPEYEYDFDERNLHRPLLPPSPPTRAPTGTTRAQD